MEMMTFVHVSDSATTQDSNTVLAILVDVFIQLQIVMPELQTIHIRSDHVGSYH